LAQTLYTGERQHLAISVKWLSGHGYRGNSWSQVLLLLLQLMLQPTVHDVKKNSH